MDVGKVAKDKTPKCFVIMPISDVHGYENGHFARVYEHVIKPAIIDAGYQPFRADDSIKTDYIVVGIIQQIVESDIVVCDYSSRNPNVMYELGIRHAFNKSVVLIKDKKTEKIFDIQGLRYTEYDETLRIDSVQKDVIKITTAIKETATANPDTVNSVVQLAGIKAAEVPAIQNISAETGLILKAVNGIESRLNQIESTRHPEKYFTINDSNVLFLDGSQASIGTTIFDSQGSEIGALVDIHPIEEKIYIKNNRNGMTVFMSKSIKSKGLTSLPF